jgi:hypothetical protein
LNTKCSLQAIVNPLLKAWSPVGDAIFEFLEILGGSLAGESQSLGIVVASYSMPSPLLNFLFTTGKQPLPHDASPWAQKQQSQRLWMETSETMSQNKLFFSLSCLWQVLSLSNES